MDIRRVTIIVLDGVGAGEAPDAEQYGDTGSNSLRNTASAVGGLNLPNLEKQGFGYITPMQGVDKVSHPLGAYGRLCPQSAGKDTVTGHWELMGVCLEKAFPTYPHGFPRELLAEYERRIGREVIGNYPASGTEIIKELGMEHLRTGKPIIYTSGDSVFQIAANEAVIPIEEQYRNCQIARELLRGEHAVGRVIARPFVGDSPENFKRTDRRHDYPLRPDEDTVMDKLVAHGKDVYSIGKIDDIFGGRGITHSRHTLDNEASSIAVAEFLREDFEGLIFANLIEFDMIYGHRNDPRGYADALERFDRRMPEIIAAMKQGDIGIITGDHGVDPTTPGTDHTREHVPLLVFGPAVQSGVNLGTRSAFSDVGATICEIFNLPPGRVGNSFLDEIRRKQA